MAAFRQQVSCEYAIKESTPSSASAVVQRTGDVQVSIHEYTAAGTEHCSQIVCLSSVVLFVSYIVIFVIKSFI
jgi:hypothetical protein